MESDERLHATDLVCAVEMAGPLALVGHRREVVHELLEFLARKRPGPQQLRVAVLGCTDHVYERGMVTKPVVRVAPLAEVSAALRVLANLASAPRNCSNAAPLEDMLYEAALLLADSYAQGRAARLLVVAGRPPHPSRRGGHVHACPWRHDWRTVLHELTGRIGASCVAITDGDPQSMPGDAFWRMLGQSGLHALGTVSAQQLGDDLGLLG